MSREQALATPQDRNRAVTRVLWAILIANWAVAGLKLAAGLLSGSAAITADALHSFIDGGSNVIGLVAMHFASQPADAEHPYGHQKFEALASLAIGVMIGMGVLELGRMAFDALVHNRHPAVGPASLAVMVGTLVVNLIVTRVEAAQGRKLRSTLLLADASHTMSDVFVTLAVIASLGLSAAGFGRADGVVALLVLLFVAYTGWQIIRQAIGILADTARVDPLRLESTLKALPGLRDVASVRSRGLEGHVYVDLVVRVDPGLSLHSAHELADQVEAAVVKTFPEVVDVVVHVEPAPR
jgi:cation diffusion facilitator family transporter